MLVWDPEEVATMFRTKAVMEDNSSYRFAFNTRGGIATLIVFPYNGEVSLSVGEAGREWAVWRLYCTSVTYNDELPEEGGPSLALNPTNTMPPSHSVVIGQREDGDEIHTVCCEPSA